KSNPSPRVKTKLAFEHKSGQPKAKSYNPYRNSYEHDIDRQDYHSGDHIFGLSFVQNHAQQNERNGHRVRGRSLDQIGFGSRVLHFGTSSAPRLKPPLIPGRGVHPPTSRPVCARAASTDCWPTKSV